MALVRSGSCAGVSLDCFDTLLARGAPDWEQKALAEAIAAENGFSTLQARDMLRLAHKRAKQLVGGDEEPSAVLIWTEFCISLGIPEHVATQLCAHEMKLLDMTSIVSCEASGFVAALESRRIPWIVCSDTRWPAAALSKLLHDKGLPVRPESIVTSCDHRKSKFRGGLYSVAHEHLAQTLGQPVSPSDILHVGDNFLSDVCSAACFGMLAVSIPRAKLGPAFAADLAEVESYLATARQDIAHCVR